MSDGKEKIYCFDTSVFAALNKIHNYIPIPDVWEFLEQLIKEGKIISHEIVFDELNPGDFIGKWIEDKKNYFIGITEQQIKNVEEILKQFPDLIDPQKEKNQADPWLIALAMERKKETLFDKNKIIYVVSQEKISSNKKIPAACRAFNIEHFNLESFLKDNGLRFGIVK